MEKEERRVSVTEFGACGNGIADDSGAIQRALDSGAQEIFIPHGRYKISRTLLVHSNTRVLAEPTARIFMDGDAKWRSGDYLLTNADHETGNENIAICGGTWDGNNAGKNLTKGPIEDLQGYSGCVLNFFHVSKLHLSDLTVANSVTYYVRMACLHDFVIENIGFLSDALAFNQDGLHFGGDVKNGVVRNIRALSKGQTNDDLIALNADDCMERVENVGMVRADIENILFENLYADDCYTIIRLLSVTSAIRNITIRNVYAGFRCYAINMDGARYCRTPLFDEADYPHGVGLVERVSVENMTCFCTEPESDCRAAICMETLSDGLELRNFNYLNPDEKPALAARNVMGQCIEADGEAYLLRQKNDDVECRDFKNLKLKLCR